MSELLPFTLPILLLLKRRVKATRWRVLSEVISFWPVWQYPKDPTVNKVFNVFVNCKHFYPKIDISSVNSTQGMMSCHHAGKSIPGCLENRDMISEGHPTSTGISQHSSNDPEYCFPTFKKNWYSCWIKTTLNQDFLKVKEVVITMMLKKKKKSLACNLLSTLWSVRNLSSPRHGFNSLLTQENNTTLLTAFSRFSALPGT